MLEQPDYAKHFDTGGVWRVWREGMYGIRDTYQILRWLGGYDAHYVNVGWWPDGLETKEPGRRLALLHGETLGLKPGDKLLDCGCGLGQGAIDALLGFLQRLLRIDGLGAPCGDNIGACSEEGEIGQSEARHQQP